MSVLAQQDGGKSLNPGFLDNEVLDQFQIPVGAWADQSVDWIAVRLEWLLGIIEWPFDRLIGVLVGEILEPTSWVWILLAFFLVGSLTRNVKVGAFAAVSVGLCAFLGNNYWLETVRTVGFVGVAVILCVIIGIPLGVACGRADGVWRVVRPVLDGMQVIHSFVYMLPFIFFFGIGEVPATMVTMVFALPPLVRLTNLGIRQVPADVVEASRAYGAPEWRVLVDVQLPLARPAITTGINQTLLLAISMLGIAAIMGAGGLGRLLLRAITNQDIPKGMASGLAFFLVAVALDRISQPEGAGSTSLLRRTRLAWAHRRQPEALLAADESQPVGETRDPDAVIGRFAAVTTAERTPILVAAAGGLLAAVSVFPAWNSGAGFISAYGRRADEELPGESFNGLAASGGSWFGYLVIVLGLLVVAAAATTLVAPGRGPRWWTADGAVIASLALLVMMICYALAAPSDLVAGQSTGVGVYLALAGGLVASAGSLWWIRLAPHAPIHPLTARIGWGRVVGSVLAVVVIGVGAISGWSFDGRSDVVITADTEARIAELKAIADAKPSQAGVVAAEISALTSQHATENLIVTDGITDEGARLGLWTLLAGLVGLAVTIPAAGVFGRDERKQWRWSAITAGVGAGVVCVGSAWVFTLVRSADPSYFSGVGSFLTMIGGCVLVATAASVLREFRRSKVYVDPMASKRDSRHMAGL